MAAWFGPKGAETTHSDLDLRVGGSYHYAMKSGGVEMWGLATYREIEKPAKLVYVQQFSDKDRGLGVHPLAPTWPKRLLTTVLFQDFGPKTLITLYWAPVEASAAELKTFSDGMSGMNQGWGGSFDRLDAFLQGGKMSAAKTEPRLVLKRLIAAPRERVFRAWVDPKEFAKWWGPHGFTAPVVEFDARPGGKIVVHMQGPKGSPWEKPYPMGGEFREVSPFDRLVFTSSIAGGGGELIHENLNELTFSEKEGKTELVLKVTVLKTSPEFAKSLEGMEQGWTQSLEKLDALFA